VSPCGRLHFRYCTKGLLRGAKRPHKKTIQSGSLDSLRAKKKERPTEWIAFTQVKGIAGENSRGYRSAPDRRSALK